LCIPENAHTRATYVRKRLLHMVFWSNINACILVNVLTNVIYVEMSLHIIVTWSNIYVYILENVHTHAMYVKRLFLDTIPSSNINARILENILRHLLIRIRHIGRIAAWFCSFSCKKVASVLLGTMFMYTYLASFIQ
jgi:hypothetical protein